MKNKDVKALEKKLSICKALNDNKIIALTDRVKALEKGNQVLLEVVEELQDCVMQLQEGYLHMLEVEFRNFEEIED